MSKKDYNKFSDLEICFTLGLLHLCIASLRYDVNVQKFPLQKSRLVFAAKKNNRKTLQAFYSFSELQCSESHGSLSPRDGAQLPSQKEVSSMFFSPYLLPFISRSEKQCSEKNLC